MWKLAARFALLAGAVLAGATAGCAEDPPAPRGDRPAIGQYNLPADRVAMQGYSPVSYFEKAEAQQGTTPFVVSHRGIHYKFTSPMQMDKFRADPAKYEPAYGGWCALGMAAADKNPVDPRSFKIVEGRLLLFQNSATTDALSAWNGRDEKSLAEQADDNWKLIVSDTPAGDS